MIERFVVGTLNALAYTLLGVAIGIAFMMHERASGQAAVRAAIYDVPKIQHQKKAVIKIQGSSAPRIALAAPVRIGIIDTGYSPALYSRVKICTEGSWDFEAGSAVIGAPLWHGTAVSAIIASQLEAAGVDYCLVEYQVMTVGNQIPNENVIAALQRARSAGLTAVNISLGDTTFSHEFQAALEGLAGTTRVFVAAGNDRLDLNTACRAYPACFKIPNVVAVGALDMFGDFVAGYSNTGGTIQEWFPGTVEFNGSLISGTSFASPLALSDYVRAQTKSPKTQ